MTKYTAWRSYFAGNDWTLDDFPWTSAPTLIAAERAIVASSLPQFQQGENSDGNGLIARAQNVPVWRKPCGCLSRRNSATPPC